MRDTHSPCGALFRIVECGIISRFVSFFFAIDHLLTILQSGMGMGWFEARQQGGALQLAPCFTAQCDRAGVRGHQEKIPKPEADEFVPIPHSGGHCYVVFHVAQFHSSK